MLFAYQNLAGVGIICRLYLAHVQDGLHSMMTCWLSAGRAVRAPQNGLSMRGLLTVWWLCPERDHSQIHPRDPSGCRRVSYDLVLDPRHIPRVKQVRKARPDSERGELDSTS